MCLACYSHWLRRRAEGYLWRILFFTPLVLCVCDVPGLLLALATPPCRGLPLEDPLLHTPRPLCLRCAWPATRTGYAAVPRATSGGSSSSHPSSSVSAMCLACYSHWLRRRAEGYLWRILFFTPLVLCVCIARQVTQSYLPRVAQPTPSHKKTNTAEKRSSKHVNKSE